MNNAQTKRAEASLDAYLSTHPGWERLLDAVCGPLEPMAGEPETEEPERWDGQG